LKKRRFVKKILGIAGDEDDDDLVGIEHEKREMIRGIAQLSETTVKEIMLPRIDVVSLSMDTPPQELLSRIIECGHSRFPVYQDTIDNVVGVLYVKDLLKYITAGDEKLNIAGIMRPAYFVPEGKKINSLLKEFKRRKVHIAVVVDEYGGTSGIVCLEDIIEEIVGDIQDEFDNETEDILKTGERVFLCDARVNVEDLNEKLDLELPQESSETLGGFVFNLFGKIPVQFEKVRYDSMDIIIQEMDGHKIQTVKLVLDDPGSQNQEKRGETD
jgi:CBS domain containing-hemolysin-like protein